MSIPIIAAIDSTTKQINERVFPLAINSLEKLRSSDTSRVQALSKLQRRGYYSRGENVVLSISFDPKSCGLPIEHCCGNCGECFYNPLLDLFNPYSEEGDKQFVITCRDTINTLLDVIAILANASKNSLQRPLI